MSQLTKQQRLEFYKYALDVLNKDPLAGKGDSRNLKHCICGILSDKFYEVVGNNWVYFEGGQYPELKERRTTPYESRMDFWFDTREERIEALEGAVYDLEMELHPNWIGKLKAWFASVFSNMKAVVSTPV